MKFSRSTWLVVILLALFLVSMRIAVSLPPLDRRSWLLDADKMVAGIYSDRDQQFLSLDLNTGVLEFRSSEEIRTVDRDPLGQWRLLTGERNRNSPSRNWELIVTNPDGSETKKQFEFPNTPTVLDVDTVITSSNQGLDLLDLRSGKPKSKVLAPRMLNDFVARPLPSRRYLEVLSETGTLATPSVFTANLYEIDDQNDARQLWSIPIANFYAFQIIDNSVYLIPADMKSIDEYHAETGKFVQSMSIPAEIVQLVTTSVTAHMRLLDLPVLILLVEDLNAATSKTRYWMLPSFEEVKLPRDETVIFTLNDHTFQSGYAHYDGNTVDEIGVLDLKTNAVNWSHKIQGNISDFSQSKSGDRWCFRSEEHGFGSFIVFDAKEGKEISRWTPFRWISWCIPATIIGFVVCSIALVHDPKLSPQLRWIALLFLSVLCLVPLFTHLLYWRIFDRPIPFHHFIQGQFVGALIASAAWIAWGSGRFIVRLVPLCVVACLIFALSRLTLADMSLTKEAVGSTWLAASLGFPICIGLRLIGVRGPGFYASPHSTPSWTLPIRDLFLFSTGIAMLLAVSIPVLKSIETPKAFPPGTKQMIVGAIAMYVCYAWLLFCSLTERHWLAYVSIMGIAVCLAAASTYQFATGEILFYAYTSFEMAIFRVAASALITSYVCLECIFANRSPHYLAASRKAPREPALIAHDEPRSNGLDAFNDVG